MNNRWIKISFSLAVSFYLLLVCFNNLADYGANFSFVSNVASMSDTFSGNQDWRAAKSPFVHHLLYLVIIGWELAAAIFCFTGAYRMIRNYSEDSTLFKSSKHLTGIGLGLGVLLWVVVFMTIGSEWF